MSRPPRPLLAALVATVAATGCHRAPAGVTVGAPDGARVGTAAALDRTLRRYAMYGLSGSALYAEDGRARFAAGYGLADRERGVAAARTTRYDVGSITKTFTAAAVLRLAAAGRLALDDSLGAFFGPGPRGPQPHPARRATLRQVLTHTAGFPLDPADAGIRAEDPPDGFAAKALSAPLAHAPGARYAYSNLGYGLLALVVERVSGRPFRTYVAEEFLAPLELRETGWWGDSVAMAVPGAGAGLVATGYEFSDREDVLTPEPTVRRGAPSSPMWGKWPLGAAGLVSTVGDLHRWLRALEDGRALPDSLARLTFSAQAADGGQGFGWTVDVRPGVGRRVFRGGARTGFTSLVIAYPDRRAALVYALNQAQGAGWQQVVGRSVERLLAGVPDTLPPATVAATPEALARFAGAWRVSPDAVVRVVAEDGMLVAGAEGQAAANALLFPGRTDAPAYDDQNGRAVGIVRAAARGDRADPALGAVADAAALVAWVRARVRDTTGAAHVAVLGTTPHPSGRGRLQTFVRAGGSGAPVLRLIWDNGRAVAWNEGVRWPAFARYRLTAPDAAVAFTPRTPGWASLRLTDVGGVRGLALGRSDGARTAAFPRAE